MRRQTAQPSFFLDLSLFFQTKQNSSSSAPPTTPPSRDSSSSSSGTSAAAGEPPRCAGSFTATRRACCCATTCRGEAAAVVDSASSAPCSLAVAVKREGILLPVKAAEIAAAAAAFLLRRRRRPRAGPRGSTCGPGRPRSRRRGRSGPLSPALLAPVVLPSRRRLRCTLWEEELRRRRLLRRPCSLSRPCWWGQRRTRTRHGGELFFLVFLCFHPRSQFPSEAKKFFKTSPSFFPLFLPPPLFSSPSPNHRPKTTPGG